MALKRLSASLEFEGQNDGLKIPISGKRLLKGHKLLRTDVLNKTNPGQVTR